MCVCGMRGRAEAPLPDAGVALLAAPVDTGRFHGSKSALVRPLRAASLLQPLDSGVRNVPPWHRAGSWISHDEPGSALKAQRINKNNSPGGGEKAT